MPVRKSTLPKGTVLAGKYKVGRELGRGGMASVYEASNIDIGKRVAIKLLARHLASSQTVVERFQREARAVAKISSPHICDVYDVGSLENGTPFLVLELLEGESLYDAMVRDRQMSPPLTLSIILQVCRGLQKAHEVGIVHRDLKPENIFLTVDSDANLLVKILDFGLAKFYDPMDSGDEKQVRLTREGAVFGTPAYMSPEQVRGQAAADTRADLWAMACITYECFTGATVWKTEDGVAMTFAQIATSPIPDPREYRPDLPLAFCEWFSKALDRKIENRFQTVRQLADGLISVFDYSARGGGLDARLISELTHEAAGADSEAVTQRKSREPGLAKKLAVPRSGESQPGASSPFEIIADEKALLVQQRATATRNRIVGTVLLGLSTLVAVAAVTSQGDGTPPPKAKVFGVVAARLAKTKNAATSGFRFVAKHAWLPRVREAQVLISRDQLDRALGMLRRVFDETKHGMARNLVEQVQVAMVAKTSRSACRVTGYARPRRYDLLSQHRKPVQSGPPVIAFGISGAIMTWTDARDGHRRIYAVPIDESLRNRSLPINITPEGFNVGRPTILPVAQRFMAVYWDLGGSLPGTYLRWLGSNAVIAGAPILVSTKKPGRYNSHASRTKDGGFAVGWTHQVEADAVDLFFRRFDQSAKPVGGIVRLTDYLNRGATRSRVRHVRVGYSGKAVHLAYEFIRGPLMQIRYQRLPLGTKAPGLPTLKGGSREERTLTQELKMTPGTVKASLPSIGCIQDGCFISWQQLTRGGAVVAFIDAKSAKIQWQKRFAPRGRHPTIGVAPNGDVRLVWYDHGRLTTATLGREGVGPRSKIARVVGTQPPPSIAPGAKRGEWYVAWLDYESGRLESYATRILCP